MNDETRKRGRPPRKPDLEGVLEAIKSGTFDEDLARIQGICENRRDTLKQKVLDRVHEVFGPDAMVVTPDDEPPTPSGYSRKALKPNVFVDKARGQTLSKPGDKVQVTWPLQEEEDDEVTPDALGDSRLEIINQGEQAPIEMRGAIIAGLSVADIGD